MVSKSPIPSKEEKYPVERKTYAKLPQVLDVPNLVEVQLDSFQWLQE